MLAAESTTASWASTAANCSRVKACILALLMTRYWSVVSAAICAVASTAVWTGNKPFITVGNRAAKLAVVTATIWSCVKFRIVIALKDCI